ncbi:MAG: hypothetical protein AAFO80_03795 [Pseudomonadota bacterium]
MSENNPKTDVDEVLEAVKRLVSAPAANAPAKDLASNHPVLDERLLLTPSLRVEEPVPANDIPDVPVVIEDDEALTAEGHSLEDRIAELEAAVGNQDIDFEPDGSELVDEETPRRFVFQHRPVDDRADTLTPPEPAKSAEPVLLMPPPAPAAEPAEEPEPIPLRPDRTDENAFDVGPAPEAPKPADDTALEISEDLEIDEDMLRDIVAEIVRAELQGELGERITRNVRKLVRREIHRAIMTRDFT